MSRTTHTIRLAGCFVLAAITFAGCATKAPALRGPGEAIASTNSPPVTETERRGPIVRTEVLRFTDVQDGQPQLLPIYRLGPGAFGFVAGLEIDVDGAPKAYHPDDIGLDYLANAGMPVLRSGRKLRITDPDWQTTWKEYYARAREEDFRGATKFEWHGIVVDKEGVPVVQGPDDPAPGYFVSQTSLVDREVRETTSPKRYVDSTELPYIALPRSVRQATGVRLGDVAAVYRPDNEALAFAIVADTGLSTQLGEGSVKLAHDLGHDPLRGTPARAALGFEGPLYYLLFPGSGDGNVMGADAIEERGRTLLDSWGGVEALEANLDDENE